MESLRNIGERSAAIDILVPRKQNVFEKFLGNKYSIIDAVIAFYGAPKEIENHTTECLLCVRDILQNSTNE